MLELLENCATTGTQNRGRSSARRKSEAVLRLLRSEDLDTPLPGAVVSPPPHPSGWRDSFLDGGTAAMRSRPADDRDEEIAHLRSKVAQLTMDNELLGQKCRQVGSGRPLGPRRGTI